MNIQEIKTGLMQNSYIPSDQIAFAVSCAINFHKPILVEGAPGVGKTSLAAAVANLLDVPLIRMQFYEGLTPEHILYDYDYQKQLVTIQAISGVLNHEMEGKSVNEAITATENMNFYDKQFLIPRPLLKSIMSDTSCVLLLDEVDKTTEEVEHILLEFLESYSISIPQLGTVQCDPDKLPIVFLTSNRFRELSEPLKRRCGYLFIENKTEAQMAEILKTRVRKMPEMTDAAARVLYFLQSADLEQTPSIAEGIDWATILVEGITDEAMTLKMTLQALIKNKQDLQVILSKWDRYFGPVETVWKKTRSQTLDL